MAQPIWTLLPATMPMQVQRQWCWAAVAVSVARFYDPARVVNQCDLLNQRFGQTDCCQVGADPACDRASRLSHGLKLVGHLGPVEDRAEPFDAVRAEIVSGRPVGAGIRWRYRGGAHAVLIIGVSSTRRFRILDPNWVDVDGSDYSVSELRNVYEGEGSWFRTYYTRP